MTIREILQSNIRAAAAALARLSHQSGTVIQTTLVDMQPVSSAIKMDLPMDKSYISAQQPLANESGAGASTADDLTATPETVDQKVRERSVKYSQSKQPPFIPYGSEQQDTEVWAKLVRVAADYEPMDIQAISDLVEKDALRYTQRF